MIPGRRALIVAALLTAAPATADAQIYTWRDGAGNLVLSDRPKDPSAQTYRVARASLQTSALETRNGAPGMYRTTRPLSRHAAQFDGLIEEHAAAHAVNPSLVRAVIQAESAFNPRARSHKGAMGLMQLMPATAREFGVLDPFNPAENIRAGVSYLRQLLDRYDDDEQLALAAYNAGPGAVGKYGNKIPPYKETQNYVHKIAGIRGIIRNGPDSNIYKVTELVNGRPVTRYTNTKPASGQYEVVSR
jgi:soluble lytic murein transglycosylase-like protein